MRMLIKVYIFALFVPNDLGFSLTFLPYLLKGFQTTVLDLDCKKARIFAYSSKREQSNERSGTRLKTESETGEWGSRV